MSDIYSWSPVDASNNAAPPAGWPENMQPSAVNDSARAMMGAIRRNYDSLLSGALVLPYLSSAGGTVTGNMSVSGTISATAATLGGLFVSGNAGFAGTVSATGNLNVSGATTTASLHVTGGSTMDGPLTAAAGITAAGLSVSGTIIAAALSVSGGTTLNYLNVTGTSDFAGDVRLDSNLHVGGNSELNYLHVGGATDIGGALNVQGPTGVNNMTVYGQLSVVGAASAASFQGGPGGSANLQTYGGTNHINFRWDGFNVFYRIDEVFERRFCTADNTIDGIGIASSVGGSPSGYAIVAYGGSTPYYAFVGAVSDARLKQNIEDSPVDALAAVLATPVRAFDWNPAGREYMPDIAPHTSIGLVAQELLETMPDVVGVTHFPMTEGTARLPADMHSVIYDRLTAYLLRAVQQLSARIDSLTTGESHV